MKKLNHKKNSLPLFCSGVIITIVLLLIGVVVAFHIYIIYRSCRWGCEREKTEKKIHVKLKLLTIKKVHPHRWRCGVSSRTYVKLGAHHTSVFIHSIGIGFEFDLCLCLVANHRNSWLCRGCLACKSPSYLEGQLGGMTGQQYVAFASTVGRYPTVHLTIYTNRQLSFFLPL